MINKDWRRRLKTLSERLDCLTPSVECDFALTKFQEIKSPKVTENYDTVSDDGPDRPVIDYEQLVDTLVDKGIDTAILATAWLKK